MSMSRIQAQILRELGEVWAGKPDYKGYYDTGAPGFFIVSRMAVDAALSLYELNLVHVVTHEKHSSHYIILPRDAGKWMEKGWRMLSYAEVKELAAQRGRDTADKREARRGTGI